MKTRTFEECQPHEDGTEIGQMLYKGRDAKNCQLVIRSWGDTEQRFSCRGLRGNRHLEFRALISRTVGEYIFVVLSHLVCDTLFWQP